MILMGKLAASTGPMGRFRVNLACGQLLAELITSEARPFIVTPQSQVIIDEMMQDAFFRDVFGPVFAVLKEEQGSKS